MRAGANPEQTRRSPGAFPEQTRRKAGAVLEDNWKIYIKNIDYLKPGLKIIGLKLNRDKTVAIPYQYRNNIESKPKKYRGKTESRPKNDLIYT